MYIRSSGFSPLAVLRQCGVNHDLPGGFATYAIAGIIMTMNFDLKVAVNFPDCKKCSNASHRRQSWSTVHHT